MAEISVEKNNAGRASWIWAAAAIIAVVGLMAWLFSAQEDPRVVTAGDSVVEEATVDTVSLAVVNGAPEEYYGETIFVSAADIASVLGTRAFWADVPGQNPFLVVVNPEVPDASWVSAGETVELEGVVRPVTEQDLDQWVQSGSMHPDARSQAAFVTHYLQVTRGG